MIYALIFVLVAIIAILLFTARARNAELDDTQNTSRCFEESYRDEQKKVNYLRGQRDEAEAKVERLCGQINKLTEPKKKPAKKRSS